MSDIKKIALIKAKQDFEDKFGSRIETVKNHLVWMVANRMINDFFDYEKKGIQKIKSYQVLELEQKYSHELKIDNFKINLLGKIDRLDRVEDQLRVVDYKSGFVESKDDAIVHLSLTNENP